MIPDTPTNGGAQLLRSLLDNSRPVLASLATGLSQTARQTVRTARSRRSATEPPGGSFSSWLQTYWDAELSVLDAACAGAGEEALAQFRELDKDLWALLLTREYDLYPNIRALLPDTPAPALQQTWNGTSGIALATQSLAFYDRLLELYARHGGVGLEHSRVLDFGCGWGRLTRLFARDVAPGSLFGCDPVEAILDVCRHSRVPARLARCDFIPEALPFGERFDLVYAFSVFTHLSEAAHAASLRALHAALAPGGLLVLTVRPPAYLRTCELLRPQLESLGPEPETRLNEPMYLFAAHGGQPLGAQAPPEGITYGETVVTPAYIRERWSELFELREFSLLIGDPYQLVVALQRRA